MVGFMRLLVPKDATGNDEAGCNVRLVNWGLSFDMQVFILTFLFLCNSISKRALPVDPSMSCM